MMWRHFIFWWFLDPKVLRITISFLCQRMSFQCKTTYVLRFVYGLSTVPFWGDFYQKTLMYFWGFHLKWSKMISGRLESQPQKITDLSTACLWFFYGLSMFFLFFLWFVYGFPLWFVYDLSMICLWFIYDLSMICLWFVYDLSMICLWFVYGLSMVCLWFVRGFAPHDPPQIHGTFAPWRRAGSFSNHVVKSPKALG